VLKGGEWRHSDLSLEKLYWILLQAHAEGRIPTVIKFRTLKGTDKCGFGLEGAITNK
jgi:hypothetical protein